MDSRMKNHQNRLHNVLDLSFKLVWILGTLVSPQISLGWRNALNMKRLTKETFNSDMSIKLCKASAYEWLYLWIIMIIIKYKLYINNLFNLFDGNQQVLVLLEYGLLLTPRLLGAADSNSRGRENIPVGILVSCAWQIADHRERRF